MTIAGSCHCGRVAIEAARAPDEVGSCNCSICTKLGALWAYYRPDEVRITGPTVAYHREGGTIDFLHCPACGCTIGWLPRELGHDRMAINARLLDGFDVGAVRVRAIDGASW